jgi:hypothetical protein
MITPNAESARAVRQLHDAMDAARTGAPAGKPLWRVQGLKGGARAYFVWRFLTDYPQPAVLVLPAAKDAEAFVEVGHVPTAVRDENVYLRGIQGKDGLLPVENIGIPSVWIDHIAYQAQRHKQCAFNLYAAAMLRQALSPMARAFGEAERAERFAKLGDEILAATVRRYWSADRGVFVNNLPWLEEEKQPWLCDRSLATSILFDQCPGGNTAAALKALAECPPEVRQAGVQL